MYGPQVDRLTKEVSGLLKSSARSYYELGIELFHEAHLKNWTDFQPAIGNLAISVELLLKSVVAAKAFRYLYTNLPSEAEILLCYPASLTDEHKPHVFIREMKDFAYKTIETKGAAALFSKFFPEIKQEYKRFFDSLPSIRNVSVHAAIPDFQRYELERIAYYSTKLFKFVIEAKVHSHLRITENKRTDNFIDFYVDAEINRVREKIKEAQIEAKSSNFLAQPAYSSGWDSMAVPCPVCEENGSASGETTSEFDNDGLNLNFECYEFQCHSCGLYLDSFDEMNLANMETVVDRSEDAELYFYEFHSYEE